MMSFIQLVITIKNVSISHFYCEINCATVMVKSLCHYKIFVLVHIMLSLHVLLHTHGLSYLVRPEER